MDHKKGTAELCLRKLAVDLKKGYMDLARHFSEIVAPFDIALAEIGEIWKPAHYAESLRDPGPAGAVHPPTCFAHETCVNGDEADYLLCVGRGRDLKCGLYVSICKYRVREDEDAENNGGEHSIGVVVKSAKMVSLSTLPVPLRLKALDVLDDFAAAYDAYVRLARKDVLDKVGENLESQEPAPVPAVSETTTPADVQAQAPEPPPKPASQKSSKGNPKLLGLVGRDEPSQAWAPAWLAR